LKNKRYATACNTANSGYIQRRIVKLTEDIKINYDGTVRDSNNNIFEFSYGDCNLDPKMSINVKNEQNFCDIEKIVEKLNNKYK
jgi:DNA-directed RNA polymerase II subunit RPB1